MVLSCEKGVIKLNCVVRDQNTSVRHLLFWTLEIYRSSILREILIVVVGMCICPHSTQQHLTNSYSAPASWAYFLPYARVTCLR